ncbi:MAG: sugar ABC transporter ATP-binding protein [Acidimicrobiales bacterium]
MRNASVERGQRALETADCGAVVLGARGISKFFGPVTALNDVTIAFKAGEIHALVGENGSGKSTFLNCISGMLRPDAGEIVFDDVAEHHWSVRHARQRGVGIVSQELSLIPELSVAENVLLGSRVASRHGVLSWPQILRLARRAVDKVGLVVNLSAAVKDLSVSQQQLVEIARVLALRPRLLLLDEPTASLEADDVRTLIALVKQLAREGLAVGMTSHRTAEVLELANTITILRDGVHIETSSADGIDEHWMVARMVGRELAKVHPRSISIGDESHREVALRISDVHTREGIVKGASLEVHRGEIVGLAGLMGAGRTELLESVFGFQPWESGVVETGGVTLREPSPLVAMRAGLAFVPDNRREKGAVIGMSVIENMFMPERTRSVFRRRRRESAEAQAWMKRLGLARTSLHAPMSSLSGGQQQKVILAKWLRRHPRVLLLDEPTRGIDVAAKAEIYSILEQSADEGMAIVVASSELPELLRLCDRIAVMRGGRIVADFDRGATEEEIMSIAISERQS